MPDEIPTNLDVVKKRQETADAERLAVEAETALNEARKKNAASLATDDPAKKELDAKLSAAKSAKDLADAQKAQSDSELAAIKAKIGEVPSSGITGTVKVEQGAASMETALLAAKATTTASQTIVKAIIDETPTGANVFVFAAGEVPDFQSTIAFFAQRAIVLQSLLNANANYASNQKQLQKKVEAVAPESAPVIAAAGVALDAATKLIGFFKSDFEVRGTDITADHVSLAKAVAGELLKIAKIKQKTLQGGFLKGTYHPKAITAVDDVFQSAMADLASQRTKATSAISELERNIIEIQAKLTTITGDLPADIQSKQQLSEQLDQSKASLEQLKAAVAAYDAFLSKLIGTEASITALIRELEHFGSFTEPAATLLIVKMEKAGGSNYTEKNLWTSFGSMPFKVMGGVIASYALFEGSSGALLAAGIVPIHGGFVKVNEVGTLF